MQSKEATARIKINRMLEVAGWHFFPNAAGPANIQLEPSIKLTQEHLDYLGNDFEKASKGFSRELITRFEKKIHATLARVCGEGLL